MKRFLALLPLLIVAFGIIRGVTIYFDNWNRLITDQAKFELYKYPICIIVFGSLIGFFTKNNKNETF